MPRSSIAPTRDSGQALGLVMMTVALVAVIALAVAHAGQRLVSRSRAQIAADAAALAAVSHGRAGAEHAAAVNGGVIVSYRESATSDGTDVVVAVRVGAEAASARASDLP